MRYILVLAALLLVAACGNDENNDRNATDSDNALTENSAVMFQNIDVKVEGTEFLLTGEASSATGEIFYVIDQGDDVLMGEKSISLEGAEPGEWAAFEINETLPVAVEGTEDPPIITLYGKDENNEMVNPNYIPIDLK
ncbi:hypothetical protein [Oceanobacillus damuensis]|uniref:hypothetical protein n=1 Tax=Oceanobacillus damuensis TaxID=937928 RepID=UPI0008360B90|nr:hypothetical protein [Oceanobacillus damuensis]